MNVPPSKPPAVIIAGGKSRRMFDGETAGDKTLLDLGGRTVLEHIIDRIGPQVTAMAINANGDPARFSFTNLAVVQDCLPSAGGPLAGILTAMRLAKSQWPFESHVLTVPADTPFLPRDLVIRLQSAARGAVPAIAASQSGSHYVAGLWPVALADELEGYLQAGQQTAGQWTRSKASVGVKFADIMVGGTAIDPFYNINTPGDLAEARRCVHGHERPPLKLFAIVGWKNSGKTTVTVRLIEDLIARGYRVATIKCAHHDFTPSTGSGALRDTDRHTAAGADPVGFIGPQSFGVVARDGSGLLAPRATGSDRFADLQILSGMMGSPDVVLIEGFKSAPVPKLEVRGTISHERPRLAERDPHVIAIAAVEPQSGASPPELLRDDRTAIADFVESALDLEVIKAC